MMSTGLENNDFDAFPMDDVDADRPGTGGGGQLPEGGYHFVVTEVQVKNERGSTQIECEVVAAKDTALVSRKHVEYLPWPDGEHSAEYNRIKKEQLLAWCYACKTTSAEEVKQLQQARKGFNPAWLSAMIGRQCLGFVKLDSYTNAAGVEKSSAKCEGRVWAMDNPKGKGIPVNATLWQPPAAPAAGSGSTAGSPALPQSQPQQAPTSPPAAANPFDSMV